MVTSGDKWQSFTGSMKNSWLGGGSSRSPKLTNIGGNYYYDDGTLKTGSDGQVYTYGSDGTKKLAKNYGNSDPTDYARKYASDPDTAYNLYKVQQKYGNEAGKMVRYRGNYYVSDGIAWSPYEKSGISNYRSTGGSINASDKYGTVGV